jgi:hypothetical protein
MSKLFTLAELALFVGLAAAFGALVVLFFQAGYDHAIFTR